MSEFRNDLLTRIIRIYGFEHKITIAIAKLLEEWEENEWNDKVLKILVEAHEACPCIEEEN